MSSSKEIIKEYSERLDNGEELSKVEMNTYLHLLATENTEKFLNKSPEDKIKQLKKMKDWEDKYMEKVILRNRIIAFGIFALILAFFSL